MCSECAQVKSSLSMPASPESSALVSSTCLPLLFVRKIPVARGSTEKSKIQNYMLSSCTGNQLLINISTESLTKIVASAIDVRTFGVSACP